MRVQPDPEHGQVVVTVGAAAEHLTVSDVERLHTDLEKAAAVIVLRRREEGR